MTLPTAPISIPDAQISWGAFSDVQGAKITGTINWNGEIYDFTYTSQDKLDQAEAQQQITQKIQQLYILKVRYMDETVDRLVWKTDKNEVERIFIPGMGHKREDEPRKINLGKDWIFFSPTPTGKIAENLRKLDEQVRLAQQQEAKLRAAQAAFDQAPDGAEKTRTRDALLAAESEWTKSRNRLDKLLKRRKRMITAQQLLENYKRALGGQSPPQGSSPENLSLRQSQQATPPPQTTQVHPPTSSAQTSPTAGTTQAPPRPTGSAQTSSTTGTQIPPQQTSSSQTPPTTGTTQTPPRPTGSAQTSSKTGTQIPPQQTSSSQTPPTTGTQTPPPTTPPSQGPKTANVEKHLKAIEDLLGEIET